MSGPLEVSGLRRSSHGWIEAAIVAGLLVVATGLLPAGGAMAAIGVAAVWFLPGSLLLILLHRHLPLGGGDLPVLATGLGMLWLVICSGVAVLLHAPLSLVTAMYWASVGSLLVLILVRRRGLTWWRRRSRDGGTGRTRDVRARLPLLLLAAIVVGLAVLKIALDGVVVSGDRWTYLGLIRNHLDSEQLASVSPFLKDGSVSWRQVADAWGVAIAFLARWLQVDPVDLFSLHLAPILVVLGLLLYFSLARHLFRDLRLASFALLVTAVYLVTDSEWNEGLGFVILSRTVEDKVVAAFACYPLAMIFFLRYVRVRETASLALFALCAVASGLIHPLGPAFCGLSVVGFWATRLLAAPGKFSLRSCMMTGLVLLAGGAVPLLQRSSVEAMSLTPTTFTPEMIREALALHRYTLLVLDLETDSYMAHPALLSHPVVILAALVLPWMAFRTRGLAAGHFIVGTMAALLVALFNPWLAPLVGKVITPWLLWRLTWIAPVGFIVAWAGGEAVRSLVRWSRNGKAAWLELLGGGLVLLLLVVALLGAGRRLTPSWEYLRWWNSRLIDEDLRTTLAAARDTVIPGTRIMTPVEHAHLVPALLGKSYPLAFRALEENPPQAYQDMESFYGGGLLDAARLSVLDQYAVGSILIENRGWLHLQLGELEPPPRLLAAGERFSVVEPHPDWKEEIWVRGNSELSRGEFAAARHIYRQALDSGFSPVLSHLGAGTAWLSEGRLAPALEHFTAAVEASGGNPLLQAYVGRALAEQSSVDGGDAAAASVGFYRATLASSPLAAGPAIHELLMSGLEELPEPTRSTLWRHATATYRRRLEQHPEQRAAYWRLTDVLGAGPDHAGVVEVTSELLRRWPRDWYAHYILAGAYHALGNGEKAVAGYRATIRWNPRFPEGYQRLARRLEEAGAADEAIEVLRRAARIFKDRAWPEAELGRIYLRLAARSPVSD